MKNDIFDIEDLLYEDSLIDAADAIILILDMEGKIVRINSYFEQLSGYTSEEVRRKDWFSTFLPKHAQDEIREIYKITLEGQKTSGTINPILKKNGEVRQIEWHNKTLKDSEEKSIGVFVIGHDVTDQLDGNNRKSALPKGVTLSAREIDCLLWLSQGMRNEQIAEYMNIKPVTVEFHLSNARKKLGAKTREQAIAKAIKMGFLDF